MGFQIKPNAERLQRILERQDPPAFGPDYVPSIRASREEAPSFSGASEVWAATLGRYVHVLSPPEFKVLSIALHCPWLFDLQEQRLLHLDERSHPLQGHPLASRIELPNLRGVLEVAESLGVLRYYPTTSMPDGEDSVRVPLLLAGDLLLFLTDAQGPFCVNLDIKETSEAFHKPFTKGRNVVDPVRAQAKEEARHLIESVRYLDGGIKTIQVATDEEIDPYVASNMEVLINRHKRRSGLPDDISAEAIDRFQAALVHGDPPLEVIFRFVTSHAGLTRHQVETVLFQAIWRRRIRIDLFQPILLDKPLRPERIDVLEKYRTWFSRG